MSAIEADIKDVKVVVDVQNTDALSYVKGLGKGSIDLVLTDPPYAISRETNFQTGDLKGDDTDRFRVSMDFGKWDVVDPEYFKALFKELYRVLRKGGTCVVFYDAWKMQELRSWLEEAGFKMFRKCYWEKTNPVPLNRKRLYLSNSHEEFLVCVKGGAPTYNMHWMVGGGSEYHPQDKGIFRYPICHEAGRFHPTQKPLGLIKELVSIHSNVGDSILDPFMGSGTTAVASKEMERNAYGSELSDEYFPKLIKRLEVGND